MDPTNNTVEYKHAADNVNDDLESEEEELLAIGGETNQEQLGEENNQVQPPEQRTNFSGIDREDACACTRSTTVATTRGNDDGKSRCHLCGKVIEQTKAVNESSSTATSVSENEPSVPLRGQTFANALPFLPNTPETSLEGNNASYGRCTNIAGQHTSPVVEGDELKTPVQNYADSSVQVPSPGKHFTFYTLGEDHPATNEKWFSVYFVTSQRFQEGRVSRWIRTMEEQQGIKTDIVPIGDEHQTLQESQYFHSAFIDNHMNVTIKFQLLEQQHGQFRIRDAQIADKAPLHRILSLSQNRIPGAIAKVFVECLAGPGHICQAHLRMALEYGDTIRIMLIPIWLNQAPDGNNLKGCSDKAGDAISIGLSVCQFNHL